MTAGLLPDPALVVLVGASAAGKSTWAAARYRAQEVVSSDDLRGVVGSGRHDLDATGDAFALLDAIVAARARRGLTCVVDTLGLDPQRRQRYLAVARAAGLPAVAVVFDVPAAVARQRNAARDHPVPAPALASQLSRAADVRGAIELEGWDVVLRVSTGDEAVAADRPAEATPADRGDGPDVVLQLSRFPWGEDPQAWLTGVARAADEAGFAGVALMDHLIQIPQVERAWSPIPEPFVTLGLLAGLDTRLRLGTLVSPVTFRAPGIVAKTVATLDALSGGRAFLGLGAGWWEREHAAYGLPFPSPAERLDALETTIETIRALWAPGTKAFTGARATLPETTCYPRPASDVPIIVGGNGARSLRIAARLGDACNLRGDAATIERLVGLARRLRPDLGITVLDLPVVGRDREQVWQRVETARGRTSAATFARTRAVGTYLEQRERYLALGERGVRTVFVALGHLASPQDVLDAAPMLP